MSSAVLDGELSSAGAVAVTVCSAADRAGPLAGDEEDVFPGFAVRFELLPHERFALRVEDGDGTKEELKDEFAGCVAGSFVLDGGGVGRDSAA